MPSTACCRPRTKNPKGETPGHARTLFAADDSGRCDRTFGWHSLAAEDAAPQSNQPRVEQPSKASDAKPDELSAEEVARRFFTALLTRDEATIKRYTIPSPGAEILWRGPPLSAEMRAAVKERMAKIKFRRLKAGDKVTGPSGTEYTIDPIQINDARVLLLPDGFALPFTLVHSDLGWRVKIDGLIAARQAAEKEEEQQQQQDKPDEP